MKRFPLLTIAAAILWGCTSHTGPDFAPGQEIEISAQMSSYATKATDTAFEEGDQMNLAALWLGTGSIDVRKATYKNGKITLDQPLYWPEEPGWEEANFVMVYPYLPGYTQENIMEYINGEVLFTVKADQSTHKLYTSSDLMTGISSEVQESDAPCPINVVFTHSLSKVSINISNTSNIPIKDVYLSEVNGTYELNSRSTTGSKGQIKTQNTGDNQWICIIPPQVSDPKILITTRDNKEITFTAPYEISFPESVQTSLTLTLGDDTQISDFSSDIIDWNDGQEYNFGQKEWESIGIGAIQDWFFQEEDDFFPVEIERNKENAHSFRVKDPYSKIKQKYYPADAPTPDEYLYFRIFDKGERFYDVTVTRDNLVYFESCAPGAHIYNQDLTICHPSEYYKDLALWKYNRVVWFQNDGTPGQVNLAPMYMLDDGRYYDYIGDVEQITILFPGCDIRSYGGAISAEDGPYGKGIIKENGKTFLSFNVEKTSQNVTSLRVAALNGDVTYYEDIIEIEDGIVDSQIIADQSKQIKLEIPDNYASHAIYLITYGDGYPQWRYHLILRDESADYGNWQACGKGSYEFSRLTTGTADDLILYRDSQDNSRFMIKEWWSPSETDLMFTWNDEENYEFTIDSKQLLGTYNDASLYISDYTAFYPASNKSYYVGNDYLYHCEGEGYYYFMTCYHSDENVGGGYNTFKYGYESFILEGNDNSTKSPLLLSRPVSNMRNSVKFTDDMNGDSKRKTLKMPEFNH